MMRIQGMRGWALLLVMIAAFPSLGNGADEAMNPYLAVRERDFNFSGAVLVSRGDRILLSKGVGMADYEAGAPNRPETIFPIASLTKQFTAMGILVLADRGLLAFDNQLGDLLPNCPTEWREVTLHHLLTHTSGIPDAFSKVDEVPVDETLAAIYDSFAKIEKKELRQQPGTKYSYSNYGYVLLGAVIEETSGEKLMAFFHKNIFEPLGMTKTGYHDVWAIVPGRARGYRFREGRRQNIAYEDHGAYAAGGLLSTVGDLYRWHRALGSSKLVASKTQAAMFAPFLDEYAYGWKVTRQHGHTAHQHNGGLAGFSAHIARYPEEDLLVVVLGNSHSLRLEGIACDLAALALGETLASVTPQKSAAFKEVGLEGIYADEKGARHHFFREGGTWRYRRDERRPRELFAWNPDTLAMKVADELRFRIEKTENGKVVQIESCDCGQPVGALTRLAEPGQE